MTTQAKALFDTFCKMIPVIFLIGSVVVAFSILAENVAGHEKEIIAIKSTNEANERYNTSDHKAMLQKLGEIQGTLDAMQRRPRER
jgi:hypothetical protein